VTDAPDNGGATHMQLSPEEQKMLEEELSRMIGVMASIIRGLAPHLTEQQAWQLAAQAHAEAQAIAPAIEHAAPQSKEAHDHPYWGFRVHIAPHKDHKTGQMVAPQLVGTVYAPKVVTPQTLPHEVVANVQVLSIATSPIGRAVLRAHGYAIDFYQGPAPKDKSLILMPGS
jgi:biotin carboxyl carrier protein